jgi:MFS family permease
MLVIGRRAYGYLRRVSSGLLAVVAIVVTVIAAARSTWSPCGLSMLSTITPLGERSRGHRYAVTVAWFIAGAVIGGAALGGMIAPIALLVHAIYPSRSAIGWTVVTAATICVASDLRLGGFRLPSHPRQVDEVWLGRYRRWVYGLGFGAQIGFGFATYVMTAAVYLTVVVAALTGSPVASVAFGTGFGLVRGLAVLLGAPLTTPQRLRAFHRRIEALAATSLAVAVIAQVGAFGAALAEVTSPVTGAVAAAVGATAATLRLRRPVAEHVGVGRGLGNEIGDQLAELAR